MHPREPDPELLDLAGSLADDQDVDWARVGEDTDPVALDGLRHLEGVVSSFRSVAGGEADSKPRRYESRVRFRWGPLEVHERVGRGSYGDVYRAIDTRLETEVALKLARPDKRAAVGAETLIGEARKLARVRHPNVVAVHGADVFKGRAGYWMDFIRGATLSDTLEIRDALPVPDAIRIGADLCAALVAVHAAGLIHGDLKPANVMLSVSGRAMLTDFGTARILSERADTWLSATPRVTAPEVWKGGEPSPASDVYALGTVMYRALAGAWPFDGKTASDIENAHVRGDHVRLVDRREDLPHALLSAVEQALDPDPSRRPQSLEMLGRTLRHLVADDVDEEEPEASISIGGTNLPVPPSSFVGRERELDDVVALLRAHRIVTLTGPGGTGKTRLAVQLGSGLVGDYAQGVWWIDLAGATDRDGMLRCVARGLGIGDATASLLPRIGGHLKHRRVLLLLDNCEQIRQVAKDVVTALGAASPETVFVITSREPLRVDGEAVYRVPPLELPDTEAHPLVVCARAESARLFVERASAASRDFALDEDTGPAVLEICMRTDGLPLALELAASRVAGLAPSDVAEALARHIDFSHEENRDATGRHDTIDACIDWSYGLLEERERALFARLSVFHGGWRLEDAAHICTGGALEETAVPSVMCALIEKSLVERDPTSNEVARYRMLETIRGYAARRFAEAAERENTCRCHAERFLEVASANTPPFSGPNPSPEIARLEEDHDNLVAALQAFVRHVDGQHAIALGVRLGAYWLRTERWREGRDWCQKLVALDETPEVAAGRAEVQRVAGMLEFHLGDAQQSLRHGEAAAEAFAALGDERGLAGALRVMGSALQEIGDLDRAKDVHRQSLETFERLGDRANAAIVMKALAVVHGLDGDFDRAGALARRAEGIFRQLGDDHQAANSLAIRGDLAMDSGNAQEAKALRTDYLEIARRLESSNLEAMALTGLASIALHDGDLDTARTQAETARAVFVRLESADEAVALRLLALVALEALDLDLARGHLRRALQSRLERNAPRRIGIVVWTYGRLALALGRPDVSARLQGAAHAHAIELGLPGGMEGLRDAAKEIEATRSALGDEQYLVERAAGARLSIDDAIGLALATCG